MLADLPALQPDAPAAPTTDRRRPGFRRGHGDAAQPAPEWTPTAERFRDPRTQRIMRVWEDPEGGRHYVPEP